MYSWQYVGVSGYALKLIKSYFPNRTQRVQIDGVLSDFANIICGVPHGSVLRQIDTQLYITFKFKQSLEAISKVNSCLSDIRRWMITNKFKINESKT